MSGIFPFLPKPLFRFLLLVLMIVIIFGSGYILAATYDHFSQTSYRFVFFFLIIIFGSNILAKLAVLYIITK
jgi:hypothetical protein